MIYMTYNKESGKPTGFITESGPIDSFKPPEQPFILVSEERYRQILLEPRKYSVVKGQLEYIPDTASSKSRAEAFARIERQREAVRANITSGVILKGYRYETTVESQINYNAIVLCDKPFKVWAFSISKSEWQFIELDVATAKDVIERTQSRREYLSEVSHLTTQELDTRVEELGT